MVTCMLVGICPNQNQNQNQNFNLNYIYIYIHGDVLDLISGTQP